MEKYKNDLSRVRRSPKRGAYDAETVHRILDAGFVAQVGFELDGQPFQLPMLYARRGSELLLHASPKSRFYKVLSQGIPCTLGVTFIDGLVLARSAFHHSVNYRSVVAFGSCTEVTDPAEKLEAFRYFTNAIVPGRFEECRPMHAQEAEVTVVLSFAITAASAKVRTGGPNDDAADYALPIRAGVVPYVTGYGPPVTDESGVRGVELPGSVVGL